MTRHGLIANALGRIGAYAADPLVVPLGTAEAAVDEIINLSATQTNAEMDRLVRVAISDLLTLPMTLAEWERACIDRLVGTLALWHVDHCIGSLTARTGLAQWIVDSTRQCVEHGTYIRDGYYLEILTPTDAQRIRRLLAKSRRSRVGMPGRDAVDEAFRQLAYDLWLYVDGPDAPNVLAGPPSR